jgi:hypothetical protein
MTIEQAGKCIPVGLEEPEKWVFVGVQDVPGKSRLMSWHKIIDLGGGTIASPLRPRALVAYTTSSTARFSVLTIFFRSCSWSSELPI